MGGTYIIHPIWFYIFNVCQHLSELSFIALLLSIGGFAMAFFILDFCDFKCVCKKFIIAIAILLSLTIFVPSQKTCYQMMVASLATHENVEIAAGTAKNVVDYIIESVDELIESNEEEKAE